MSLYGTLGARPGVVELWRAFNAYANENRTAGFERDGVLGRWELDAYYTEYAPHRKGAPLKERFHSHAQWVQRGVELAPDNAASCGVRGDNELFWARNFYMPKPFFDWGKRYLAALADAQPDFDAAPEAKLVWSTHVAWTINMMLGATNLHGDVLSGALLEGATGRTFSQWNAGPLFMSPAYFMDPALHMEATPPWFLARMNQYLAAVPATGLVDFGYRVFRRSDGKPIGTSTWRGAPWPVPFETARLRWDTRTWNGKQDCPRSGRCTNIESSLRGATFNNGQVYDPFYVPSYDGTRRDDGGLAIRRYTRWSYAVPWLLGIQSWGPSITELEWRERDRTNNSLLREALRMSTFFAESRGTSDFWAALRTWQKDATPRFVGSGATKLYQPNMELSFRYFYPAMISVLLKQDFSELVANGINAWWNYNVGSRDMPVAQSADASMGRPYADDGACTRTTEGGCVLMPVVPLGEASDARVNWQAAKDKAKGIGFIVNWIGSMIAIVQAVFGSYGSLYKAAKGWYDYAKREFPRDDDLWRGTANPTPIVLRLAKMTQISQKILNMPSVPMLGPDPNYFLWNVAQYMYALSMAVGTWASWGIIASNDAALDIEHPVAKRAGPRSPVFPDIPEPGTEKRVGVELDLTPDAPPTRSPVLAILAAAGVGAAVVYTLRKRRAS